MPVSKIEDAIEDIRAGKMVIIVDDDDRENEGDLAMSAEMITPAAINFMATYGRGLICVPMLGPRLEQLRLPMMTQDNTARLSTAFTVSVDVLKGATTGISAADRSATIKALIDPETLPEDLGKPGHIFPLRYMEGGVLKRAGQTEASVDLARLAGQSWISGNEPTIADIVVAAPMHLHSYQKLPLSQHGNVVAWYERLEGLPCWSSTDVAPLLGLS